MTQFPLAKVWVDAERQRRDLGDLTELKDSIQTVGLINPIAITRNGQLIAGERRYAACRELGKIDIPVTFIEDMSPAELKRLEYDENIRRKDLTWQEQCLAVMNYHELCLELEPPGWKTEDSAARLGLSTNFFNRLYRIADALRSGDRRVLEAPTLSVANGIVERTRARQQDVEFDKVKELINADPNTVTEDTDLLESLSPSDRKGAPCPVRLADFTEWAKTYKGPPFNLIHCDFPYGIQADNHDHGSASAFGGYEDSEEVYWTLLATLGFLIREEKVAKAAHMIFWFSMKYYSQTMNELTNQGWTVNPTPLVWFKSDNAGILPDPRRMPRQVYETAFLCSRGDRFLALARANVFPAPVSKRWHMSEKPVSVLNHFFSMVCDDTTNMLDPTAGSGNSCIAAKNLGARRIVGLEINPEFHANAVQNWKENIHGTAS